MPTETSGTAAASCKIGVKMQDSSPGAMPTISGGHHLSGIKGGEVYNSEGQKESAVRCNSPPRSYVPFSDTNPRFSRKLPAS